MRSAYIFTGQGGQFSGMGQDLYNQEKVYKDTMDFASSILNVDVMNADFIYKNTQLAIMLMSVSIFRVLTNDNFTIDYLGGLSLGEYSALICSGALSLDEGIRLVSERSRLMKVAASVVPSAMLAISGSTKEYVESLCQSIEDVYPANYNSKNQIVVGGSLSGIDTVESLLTTNSKVRLQRLKVEYASHTPFMEKARQGLGRYLESTHFSKPQIPVFSTTKRRCFQLSTIKSTLRDQLVTPTHFDSLVEFMETNGIKNTVEIGPGHVLSSLIRHGSRQIRPQHIDSIKTLNQFREKFLSREGIE